MTFVDPAQDLILSLTMATSHEVVWYQSYRWQQLPMQVSKGCKKLEKVHLELDI
jgi:hypothetical protein